MAGYKAYKITGPSAGLIQDREEFLLPDDAYPVLQNAYVFRERILRKKGYELLGRLQRNFVSEALGTSGGGGGLTRNIYTVFSLEPTSQLVVGSVVVSDGTNTFTDNGLGVLVSSGAGSGLINYSTGDIRIFASVPNTPLTISFGYYPGLPVMGIRIRELQNSSLNETIFFDQVYAYIFNSSIAQFQEFIPGTTWNAHAADVSGTDFFWSTNYWVSDLTNFPSPPSPARPQKLMWVTNNTGQFGANQDPPRITDGFKWLDFFPSTWSQIDATNFLTNFLCMLPYRGRMVVFNTYEGTTAANAINFSNRIRWSTIGNPFIPYDAGPPATGSWRDDIRGQGGFLDIPTSEDIVSIGFVRDNLVIYCERSTWQLRYTGRSIAPFQIERVNSELGTESTFSSIQFDTSLVGIGDKGIVECDSYKSERIDIKIPDFVYKFSAVNNGVSRVQGVRDFPNRLAYWTIPYAASYDPHIPTSAQIFPNQRLVYNYENDSWALFNDSLTALGNYQAQTSRNWLNTKINWLQCNFPWIAQPLGAPLILGGNQQGFIEILNVTTTNDVSLYIAQVTGNTTTATVLTCPNHNMQTGFVIQISGIPTGTPYAPSLNGKIFAIVVNDANNFQLWKYDPVTLEFSIPQTNLPSSGYVGGGLINIRENFTIRSKKFNFLDQGNNIQLGYLDILMSSSGGGNPGAISLNIFLNYDQSTVSNIVPENDQNDGSARANPDTFFNSIIPTTQPNLSGIQGEKFWQRVYCATRASFLTLEYTFSNAQMIGIEQENDVQIDAQILWIREAGRMSSY